MQIKQLKYLLPDLLTSLSSELLSSIQNSGVMSPIIMFDNLILDGNRRVMACRELGIQEIDAIILDKININPYLLFIEFNLGRSITPFEAGWLFTKLDVTEHKVFCGMTNIQSSPQMLEALEYLGNNFESLGYQLPLNVWRELAHISNGLSRYGLYLSNLNGTVSEKRVVANLLRHCFRKKSLPDCLIGNEAKGTIAFLEQIAKPRQNEALSKWNNAIANIKMAKGLKVKIDPTFEKPGINVNIHILRKNIHRIDETKEALVNLFEAVKEL